MRLPDSAESQSSASSWRSTINRRVLTRLAVTWAVVVTFQLGGSSWLDEPMSPVVAIVCFAVLFSTILVAAFGVVRQADHLAEALGEPYGTLVLTLSIVVIEVVLISAVMLGPGDASGIGRDSIFSLLMIALNLVMGICLIAGGIRNGEQDYNAQGAISYLSLIAVFVVTALLAPNILSPDDGAISAPYSILFAAIILSVYGSFLFMQTSEYSHFFVQSKEMGQSASDARSDAAPGATSSPREVLIARGLLLIAFVIPIVLLSNDLAVLIDYGIGQIGAPAVFGGVLISVIVFTPESLTALRAALADRFQRAVNIVLGACLSTLGGTIPAILLISFVSGQTITLGLGQLEMLFIVLTLGLTALTFLGHRTSRVQGMAHLTVFAVFVLLLFR